MMQNIFSNRALIAFVGAVLVFLIGTMAVPGFGSMFSVRAMLILASLLAIAALGQTLVMILGGIDLSIPFVIGFANVVFASLYGNGMPGLAALLIVVIIAGCIGALSGGISAGLAIHPLIVTLGIGTVIQAAVQIWSGGLPTGSAPPFVNDFVSLGGTIGPLPFPWLIPFTAALALGCLFLLRRTVFGRRLYALGSNLQAAELALVRPVVMWMMTFALSAVFAALAGILLLGFTGSSSATVGAPYLFQTVSAVVIGGTALIGGRGGFAGTLAGAIVLVELRTMLIGLGLSEALVQSALGVLILGLVAAYGRDQHIRNLI